MDQVKDILQKIKEGDRKALSRAITLVENELPGAEELLLTLSNDVRPPLIGITGPPGAGKSTLINAMLNELTDTGNKVAVIAVDPTSPFNFGSLLGDRLRMSEHFTDPNIFIRSLASRGSLGGLSEKIIEVSDVICSADFDFVIVETVGVGQSEVEIAGLADITVVVVVPESGDEIQALKSGIMEIADIFVVNKADREGAEALVNNLKRMLHDFRGTKMEVPVISTIASEKKGIRELLEIIRENQYQVSDEKKIYLLAEKAYRIIRKNRMRDVSRPSLLKTIEKEHKSPGFSIYRLANQHLKE
ncbi:MAG: methylmalonyl Co-A mutase-associated GTPase MeaB [Bacteroidetes bacterium]|nr:MAG: methylmalonyl Co-A mutase-associated GTPase MeaB [Bacteroidota bacterium]REK04755.1 MAG: methylmalonyl Co-A mutase-associated GTPase MeaB [Bacteroidota bacterium]REK51109.1 MAG: methylmalonyl Co-A mutase-associated GTPase MeaB [Bacteroidota bacterium]